MLTVLRLFFAELLVTGFGRIIVITIKSKTKFRAFVYLTHKFNAARFRGKVACTIVFSVNERLLTENILLLDLEYCINRAVRPYDDSVTGLANQNRVLHLAVLWRTPLLAWEYYYYHTITM